MDYWGGSSDLTLGATVRAFQWDSLFKCFSKLSQDVSYWLDPQDLNKVLSKPASDVCRVQGEKEQSVLTARPPVHRSGVRRQHRSDGSGRLLWTPQEAEPGSAVTFGRHCRGEKYRIEEDKS